MAAPRITIEVDLTREGLLAVRASIDELLAGVVTDGQPRRPDDEAMVLADRKVAEVWARVGENIKRFLTLGAQINDADDAEFSMQQVADALHVSPKTVRSWHRNLGRTLRQVDEVMPEPELLPGRWDGERNQYRFAPEVRSAILDRAERAGIARGIEPAAALRAMQPLADNTPAVAVSRAFAVLEQALSRTVAQANVEVASDAPSVHDLIATAFEHELISAETRTALRGLAEIRNLASHDPSGTRTTPQKAQEFLAMAGATLFALESGVSQ